MEEITMDVTAKARELGKLIQADERYVKYMEAKKINDEDTALQELIGAFNLKRADLNNEMSKENRDAERLKTLDVEIKELYGRIMANESMFRFTEAKHDMDEMLNEVNMIITMCANGEDPDTCEAAPSCSGSCSTCGGCH